MVSWLLPETPGRNMVAVTKDFFQSRKIRAMGLSPDNVPPALLGFCSLVLSYAKFSEEQRENSSPKHIHAIMPRTDFSSMFNEVKTELPTSFKLGGGALYNLFKNLACYRNAAGGGVSQVRPQERTPTALTAIAGSTINFAKNLSRIRNPTKNLMICCLKTMAGMRTMIFMWRSG